MTRRRRTMVRRSKKALSARQRAELKALAQLAEKDIDIETIPEVRDWSGATRGEFYRPKKSQ